MSRPSQLGYPLKKSPVTKINDEITEQEWSQQRLPNADEKLKECKPLMLRFFECERFHATEFAEARPICGVFRMQAQDCVGKVYCPMKSELVNMTCRGGTRTKACVDALKGYNECLFFNDVPPLIEPDKVFGQHVSDQIWQGFLERMRDQQSESNSDRAFGSLVKERQKQQKK